MTTFDFSDKAFNAARRRGYLTLAETNPVEWEKTFIGQWVLKFKNDLKVLSIFSDILNKLVEWSDLTEDVLVKFRDKVLSMMCANSARQTFSKVKTIINRMRYSQNIPCDLNLMSQILSVKAEPSDQVYLTEEELIAFANVATFTPVEQYVKCVCMIEGTTGARHIDCLNMKDININRENDTLTYTSQKTRITATVPVIFDLEKWMSSFDHNMQVLDYIFNEVLRTLLCRAGIGQSQEMKFNRGQNNVKCKYEYCSSHTFRRSYATNLFLGGVELADISQMMGHTSTEMTMRYICATRFVSKRPTQYFIKENIYKYQ